MKLKNPLENSRLVLFTVLFSFLNVHIQHFEVERLKSSTIEIVYLLYLPILNSDLLYNLLEFFEEEVLLRREQVEQQLQCLDSIDLALVIERVLEHPRRILEPQEQNLDILDAYLILLQLHHLLDLLQALLAIHILVQQDELELKRGGLERVGLEALALAGLHR